MILYKLNDCIRLESGLETIRHMNQLLGDELEASQLNASQRSGSVQSSGTSTSSLSAEYELVDEAVDRIEDADQETDVVDLCDTSMLTPDEVNTIGFITISDNKVRSKWDVLFKANLPDGTEQFVVNAPDDIPIHRYMTVTPKELCDLFYELYLYTWGKFSDSLYEGDSALTECGSVTIEVVKHRQRYPYVLHAATMGPDVSFAFRTIDFLL